MGKLIVIEGTDSSGKETQTKKIYERLLVEGKLCKKISFPNYDSDASAPVKMYLAGRFGKDAEKINPYQISTMYAIDRYASFKEDWEKDFKATGTMRGIGWVILYLDTEAHTVFNAWVTEHDMGHLAHCVPLLVMDVWEHAYMTDYGIKRADYIQAFMQSIDWSVVEKRAQETMK